MTAHACKHTRKKATILPPEHGNMLRTSAIFSTDKKGPNVHEQVLFSAPTKKVNLQTNKCFFQHRQRNERNKKKRRRVRLKRTNLRVKGLSLNRSQKWTALLSTTPRLRPRSSTNDLAPLHRTWLVSLSARGRVVSASARSRSAVALPPQGPKSVALRILSPADVEALTVSSRFSGRDSDLEAFSHNPSDGSFAPLAYQPST
jgi:hypothetical protein